MPIIVPIDLAICDPDLLWRVDHLNASRVVNGREFGNLLDAAAELTPGHPAVVVVGPTDPDLALADREVLGRDHSEWTFLFVIDTTDQALEQRLRGAGINHVIDRGLEADEVIAAALALLPADRAAVAADEREAEALDQERVQRDHGPLDADLLIVTSAKGGEGVTTVAANLASALSSHGLWRVALVEGDPAFGDLSLLLGLPDAVHYDVSQIRVVDADVVARFSFDDPKTGLRIVRAPLGWTIGELSPDFVLDLLRVVAADVDVIVLDASFALVYRSMLPALASAVLLVTARRTASIKNALVAARALDRSPNLHLVLNEATKHRGGDDLLDQLEPVVGIDLIAALPHESQLDRAGPTVTPRVLAPERSHFGKAVTALADRLRETTFRRRRESALRQVAAPAVTESRLHGPSADRPFPLADRSEPSNLS